MKNKRVKESETPGYPNKVLSKKTGETVKMTEYWPLVRKIMYLMTKLAPDLANQHKNWHNICLIQVMSTGSHNT